MAKNDHWIEDMHMKKGALHKELGVAAGKDIPQKKLASAASKGGLEGHRARLAETLEGLNRAEGGEVTDHDTHELHRKVMEACLEHRKSGAAKELVHAVMSHKDNIASIPDAKDTDEPAENEPYDEPDDGEEDPVMRIVKAYKKHTGK